jgi:hypothetical protein
MAATRYCSSLICSAPDLINDSLVALAYLWDDRPHGMRPGSLKWSLAVYRINYCRNSSVIGKMRTSISLESPAEFS